MRIVLLGTAYPMRGGIAHTNASLYRSLTAAGHDVSVISFKRQYPGFLFPGKTQMENAPPTIPIPARPLMDTLNPISWFRSAWQIMRFAPELIVFNYWMPFFAPTYATIAFLCRLLAQTKVLYICHNILPHEKKPLDGLLTGLALKFVDYFIVLSDAVAVDLVQKKPQARWLKHPHPVYDHFPNTITPADARQKLGYAPADRVLLFFGLVRKYKGVPLLLHALAGLPAELPVKLMIVGEFYEGREEVRKLVQDLGVSESVQIIDQYIPNDEVQYYFHAADLVVLPYLSATQSGIAQIAAAFQKPVLVTDVGGLAETVQGGKTGFVVPANNPDALMRKLQQFFSENWAEKMADALANNQAQFTWDGMAQAITRFMENSR